MIRCGRGYCNLFDKLNVLLTVHQSISVLFIQRDSLVIHFIKNYEPLCSKCVGHAVAQLVRHCATSRKVAGSIPDGVTGIFH
jgi:hypothetical protein